LFVILCLGNTTFTKDGYFSAKLDGIACNGHMGRAIAQAVSRRLPTAAARVQTRVGTWDFVMDKVPLGQVFSENFGFPRQSTFHHALHNHLHYHPRLAQ
jgi:hypothetical protein